MSQSPKKRIIILAIIVLILGIAASGTYTYMNYPKEISRLLGHKIFAKVDHPIGISEKEEDVANAYAEAFPGRLTFERMKTGDTLYSLYFGLLNVRKEPDENSDIIGRLEYGQEVTGFYKAIDGYIRVVYTHPITGEQIEGYCLSEDLSFEPQADKRVYLDVPDFKQYDPKWAHDPLGDSYETIWSAGCTTCCLAMTYSYLEGEITTPDKMVHRLFYNPNGTLGMPKVFVGYDDVHSYRSIILREIQNHNPVLVGSYRFNGSPHWVLVTGYTGDGESVSSADFLIHDPNSKERTTLADFFEEFPDFNRIAYYNPEEAQRIAEEEARREQERAAAEKAKENEEESSEGTEEETIAEEAPAEESEEETQEEAEQETQEEES